MRSVPLSGRGPVVPDSALRAGVIALVTTMVVGSLGIVGGALAASPAAPGGIAPSASVAPAVVPSAPSQPEPALPAASTPASPGPSPNVGAAMAAAAMEAARVTDLSPTEVFPPRPSATPQQLSESRRLGAVEPLYTASPAPLGLADYGLSAGPGGEVRGTVLNTTSLVGLVDLNATGVQPADLFQGAPDSFAAQLNAVLTNVTLFGRPGYSFWTQNVVEYYPTTDYLVLVTNIWNFSGGPLSAGDFYHHGPHGAVVGSEFYASELPLGTPENPSPEILPFDLTLWLDSSVVDGRDAVNFTVQVDSSVWPGDDVNDLVDSVVFNSIAAAHPLPVTEPSSFTADGQAYNPIGLTDDFELTIGGPGGGSQATLLDANATLGLGYWDGTGYASVPSAYSYGGDTAETSTGADVTWSDLRAGSPAGVLVDYGTMATGPSILTGLWGASGPEGSYPVTISAEPANAFVVLTPVGWATNFTSNGSEIAPTAVTQTFGLAPGDYSVLVELSDYQGSTTALDVTGPTDVSIDLAPDLTAGVYTPLWAFSNAEVGALAVSGQGTVGSPYVLSNDQPAVLNGVFGLYNAYGFPAYPGVFLMGTTATTELEDPPSFATATNATGPIAAELPAENDLAYWFWGADHVAILNAPNISGWFAAPTFYPAWFNTFSVVFYESSSDLVANATFDSGLGGLLDYAGVEPLAPTMNVGGSGTTIWGSTFETLPPAAFCVGRSACDLTAASLGLGLELAGAGNTVYNNAVTTPTTAWVVPMNLYTGEKEVYDNAFNITPSPAAVVHTVPSFPSVPLYGSIVGRGDQGGNYWWDYGLALNPYNGAVDPFGTLPYDEKATTLLAPARGYYPAGYYDASYIYPGGDDAPLLPYSLYAVSIDVRGLPKGASWTASVTNGSGTLLDAVTSSSTSHTVDLPNGSYRAVVAPAGARYAQTEAMFSVAGGAASSTTTFYTLGFREAGLPKGKAWTVVFNGTGRTLRFTPTVFYVANGSYPYLVQGPSGYVPFDLSDPGSVTVAGASFTQTISFVRGPTYDLAFHEKGLAKGTNWCVKVSVSTVCTSKGANVFSGLPSGTYPYAILRGNLPNVSGEIGRVPFPLTGSVVLDRSITVTLIYGDPYPVTFTASGLPPSGTWSVKVGTATYSNATGEPTVFELRNGTYTYKVTVAGDGIAGGISGKVSVKGGPTAVDLTWYPITFNESGLPNGTNWCITVGSGSACSPTSTIVGYEGNGTYTYRVWVVQGFTSLATPKKVIVSGAGATVTVTFAPKAAKVH